MTSKLSIPSGSDSPSLTTAAILSPSISRAEPWSLQSRNPVSQRLYKVLSTKYDDEGTKDALKTLSDFYSTPGSAASSSRNGTQAHPDGANDDSNSDDEDASPAGSTHIAMDENGPELAGVAIRARKHLRRDVERRLAEGSRKFLEAFGDVDQKLDILQEQITDMRMRCGDAETQLEQTNEACKALLERAGNLREQRLAVVHKQSIVSLFLSRFTLHDDELEAITSRDIPIGTRFFTAMDKTQRIRDDCRVLMAGEDGPTKAGLDIMASTSSHLEQGYEKIARWLTFEFRQMGRDAQLEVSPIMAESVRRLRQRPELLTDALGLLSQTRQSALLGAFLDALTRGGRGGLPRPIELHAHDPMRYVGDMLAWVHQAIAAEREFLEALFGVGARRMVGAVRTFGGGGEEEGWMRELMDGAVGKLCGPLKLRVQQTVRSQESGITSYRIANLLQFYMLTMRRTLGEEALLSQTLKEMTDVAYQVFFDAIDTHGRALLRVTLDPDDPDVTPPGAVLDHAQVLREIMAVYESSLVGDESADEQRVGFKPVLDAVIDPIVEMCVTAADEKKRARPTWDKAVFVLNCLAYLQDVMAPMAFTAEKRQMISGIVKEKINQLVVEHYNNLLHDAGLAEAEIARNKRENNEPLSRIPATQPPQLQATLHVFSDWLSGPEVLHSARLAHLAAPGLPARVHHAALARLARAYQALCEAVRRPENRYEAAATLLGSERPFGQVGLLWQIFGLREGEGEEDGAEEVPDAEVAEAESTEEEDSEGEDE